MSRNFPPIEEQLKIISRGTVDLIPLDELKKKLTSSNKKGKPLRIKQGFDPTAPDIHMGHTVGLRKLRQFQELGHQVVVIIGDYTGMVGDPSEKNSTRPRLTHEDVIKNAETYTNQFFKILDRDKTEVRYNGDWFSRMSFAEIMDLASKFTVARMLERDDFAKRYESQQPISVHEFFYPLMQGYDSVMIQADVEIGATEQKFNLVMGRQIQKEYGQDPQIVLTLPVLEGIDGTQRMSKTFGNYIGIDEAPQEIYGKTMSIPDQLIYPYFELLTDVTLKDLGNIKSKLEDQTINPMSLKRELSRTLIRLYYDENAAQEAEHHFNIVHKDHDIPDEIPSHQLPDRPIRIIEVMIDAGLASGKGEARRLIRQGGVKLDGKTVESELYEIKIEAEMVLKVGKRKFVQLVPK
jgi:tyrosyl-tRNA synthetase